MQKPMISRKYWAGVSALALLVAACDEPTRNERIVSQFSASISGAITDQFEATRDTISNDDIRIVQFYTPGHINIMAIRRRATNADFISFDIRDVHDAHHVQLAGALVMNGNTHRLFALELDVEVTRVTSNRLTGVFTGVGVESLLPDSVPPNTIVLENGQFDIALKEPIPQQ